MSSCTCPSFFSCFFIIGGCYWSWVENHRYWPDRSHQRRILGWYVRDEAEWRAWASTNWLGQKAMALWDNFRQKRFETEQRALRTENHRSAVMDRAEMMAVAARAARRIGRARCGASAWVMSRST